MSTPNILFITADQLRYDALGFQNVFPVKTPNLDALAAKGTVFDNAYCSYPLCVPSRASIMTGRYSYQHGVYYNDQGWSDDLPTVAKNLSDNGYYTVECGKTHFRPPRKHYGFNKVVNELDYDDYLSAQGIKEKLPSSNLSWKDNWEEQLLEFDYSTKPGDIPIEHYEPVFHTNNAIDELRRLTQTRQCTGNCHEPFFMWLSFLRPHTPCTPPEPYFSMYADADIPEPVHREDEVEKFPKLLKKYQEDWSCLSDERIRKCRTQYLADVTIVDEQIGRIMQTLKELSLDDNTMIIFFSDHGDHLGDHYMQQKSLFFESSARVPLIMQGPDIPASRREISNVSLVDLLPTVMDYSNLLQPDRYDNDNKPLYHHQPDNWSCSLLKTIKNQDKDEVKNRCVICETGIYGQGIMVKYRDIKYCWYPQTDELQMFDLQNDPNEFEPQYKKLNELPEPVQNAFNTVKKQTDRLSKRSYYFQGKIRPMFS